MIYNRRLVDTTRGIVSFTQSLSRKYLKSKQKGMMRVGSWFFLVWFTAFSLSVVPSVMAFEAKVRFAGLFSTNRLPTGVPQSFGRMNNLFYNHHRGGEQSNSTKDIGPSNALSYYLIWTPGMLQKTLMSFTALLVTRLSFSSYFDTLGTVLNTSSKKYVWSTLLDYFVLPLLSSACCGIQLIINFMVGAGGCAGFNKYLGPLRPYFLAILLFATSLSMPFEQHLPSLIVKLLLAFLPELLHLYDTRRSNQKATQKNILPIQAVVQMLVPTMGCVACINKINTSIQKDGLGFVIKSKSWLNHSEEGGRTQVTFVASSEEEAHSIAQTLMNAVVGAGFNPCTIETLTLKKVGNH